MYGYVKWLYLSLIPYCSRYNLDIVNENMIINFWCFFYLFIYLLVRRNSFHEKRTSLSAYVRFTKTAMVDAALKANGAELEGKHLHIDRSQGSNRNTKLAVFIGNLAFGGCLCIKLVIHFLFQVKFIHFWNARKLSPAQIYASFWYWL